MSLFLLGCTGGGIDLDIVLSSNDTENPIRKISADMQVGASTGVYFVLDELKAQPVSVDDLLTGGDTYSEPNQNGLGADPSQGEFKVTITSLNANSYYRIKMIAKDANGAVTYTGTGDCPIKPVFKENNKVKICFGRNDLSNPPLCAGLTTFTDCPGL